MQKTELLRHGKFYHIYNRGINSAPVFLKKIITIIFLNYMLIMLIRLQKQLPGV